MTGRTAATISSLAAALAVAGCTSFYEIAVETPIQPKLDVSAFSRVLIAGFISAGSEDVDANLETVRLLRSQLRSKSTLRVIETDLISLLDAAGADPAAPAADRDAAPQMPPVEPPPDGVVVEHSGENEQGDQRLKDAKDIAQHEHIFANVDFWKKLGEEYQNPLIVTGTVLFTPHSRSGFVNQNQEVYDSFGRRRVIPMRTYTERKGFILQPKFIFIDGRTGTTLYSESFREEILYNAQQNTPALSSYFELMDRLIPNFLSTLSTQKIRGSRILLK
jgi:hypothetical protein